MKRPQRHFCGILARREQAGSNHEETLGKPEAVLQNIRLVFPSNKSVSRNTKTQEITQNREDKRDMTVGL